MWTVRILGTEVFAVGRPEAEVDADEPTETFGGGRVESLAELASVPYSTDFAEEYPYYEEDRSQSFGFRR
jgi:hypothetical protein